MQIGTANVKIYPITNKFLKMETTRASNLAQNQPNHNASHCLSYFMPTKTHWPSMMHLSNLGR